MSSRLAIPNSFKAQPIESVQESYDVNISVLPDEDDVFHIPLSPDINADTYHIDITDISFTPIYNTCAGNHHHISSSDLYSHLVNTYPTAIDSYYSSGMVSVIEWKTLPVDEEPYRNYLKPYIKVERMIRVNASYGYSRKVHRYGKKYSETILGEVRVSYPGQFVNMSGYSFDHTPSNLSIRLKDEFENPIIVDSLNLSMKVTGTTVKYSSSKIPDEYEQLVLDDIPYKLIEYDLKEMKELWGQPGVEVGKAYNDLYKRITEYSSEFHLDNVVKEIGTSHYRLIDHIDTLLPIPTYPNHKDVRTLFPAPTPPANRGMSVIKDIYRRLATYDILSPDANTIDTITFTIFKSDKPSNPFGFINVNSLSGVGRIKEFANRNEQLLIMFWNKNKDKVLPMKPSFKLDSLMNKYTALDDFIKYKNKPKNLVLNAYRKARVAKYLSGFKPSKMTAPSELPEFRDKLEKSVRNWIESATEVTKDDIEDIKDRLKEAEEAIEDNKGEIEAIKDDIEDNKDFIETQLEVTLEAKEDLEKGIIKETVNSVLNRQREESATEPIVTKKVSEQVSDQSVIV